MIRTVLGLFVVVLLCGCWVVARGQGDVVTIRTISAQTADRLTFRISLPHRLYGPRQNVVINYSVRNESAKVACPPKADMEELLWGRDTNYALPFLVKLENLAKVLTVGALIVEVKST